MAISSMAAPGRMGRPCTAWSRSQASPGRPSCACTATLLPSRSRRGLSALHSSGWLVTCHDNRLKCRVHIRYRLETAVCTLVNHRQESQVLSREDSVRYLRNLELVSMSKQGTLAEK